MRVARSVLSAFLSMALVVGMVPDCAYAKVAAQALHLGASQASPSGAGDAQQASQDDGASFGEPAPADTGEASDVAAPGEVADDNAELQSVAPEEGFSYQQASGGVEVTGYAGDATELSIPEELGGSKVVGIANSALSGHASLRSVALPPSLERVGAGAFRGCSSLAGVDLPASVSFVDNDAFDGCSSLSSVGLPEGLRGLGSRVFSGCPLASVTVPASLESTGGWFRGDGPFAGSGLASARLAEGSVRVATGLFGGCGRLASVEVPGTVTSVGDRAFQGCTSLASLSLPASVTSIADTAFEGCDALTISCPRGSFAYSWAMEHGIGVAASDGTHALLDPAACSYSARRLDDGLVELTVRWGLAEPSADVSVGAVTLGVPASTDVREVRVDGAAADWSLSGRKLYVPTGAPSGSVEVLCEVPAGEASSPSYASVALRSGGVPASEVVGSVADLSSPLSISVPEVTASGTFSVRGNAPAGSRVELRVGGEVVGGATASPSGSYAATVSVPTSGGARGYRLVASCDDGAGGTATARGDVLFDPAAAGVTSFVMRYDGRDHDLLGGDPVHFTFLLSSYHGEHPFRFEVAFDAPPERVEAARVVSTKGTERKHMDLAWDASVGRWVSEGWFDPSDHDYVPGSLSVSYRTKPEEVTDPSGPGATPTPIPAGWEDVKVTGERLSEDTVRFTYTSPTMFNDENHPATITVTRRDAEGARRAGAPATVEEALAQGYEPVGPTTLSLGHGQATAPHSGAAGTEGAVGLSTLAGVGSGADSVWYVKSSEGPDGSTILDMIEYVTGVINSALRVIGSKSLENASTGLTVVNCVVSGVTWMRRIAKYEDLRQAVLNSPTLTADQKAYCLRRLSDAETLTNILNGLNFAMTAALILPWDPATKLSLTVATSVLSRLNNFVLDHYDYNSIEDLLAGYVREGTPNGKGIDPCGHVCDASTGEPIIGARATLWCRPFAGAEPELWDAPPYGQENPLVTDDGGRFAWDVPEGWYQVRVEAEGYRPAASEWFYVPSASELDVPVAMEPATSPALVGGVPPRAATRSGFLRDLGIAA